MFFPECGFALKVSVCTFSKVDVAIYQFFLSVRKVCIVQTTRTHTHTHERIHTTYTNTHASTHTLTHTHTQAHTDTYTYILTTLA